LLVWQSFKVTASAMLIDRFLRPVSYQDLPDALRPDSIKSGNPQSLKRIVDGVAE